METWKFKFKALADSVSSEVIFFFQDGLFQAAFSRGEKGRKWKDLERKHTPQSPLVKGLNPPMRREPLWPNPSWGPPF